ncbi:hypothetical protein B723_18430 [Pseudomonas fluorescens NCIMB 11764]|uniref:Nucleotidyltransferase family protein n=1 Tax=Pseudomonas fluorescens NCIMB 11764 TaxID=1221522 RepID=A0A0K1QRE2_PSEFL|nr:nucleotidyltransferase family protein [Pseudomonas fluorescens]AKV08273.1 hypothetical protein B723_18430 [Pseudomonas fluorescens NCIMB 11764]
MTLTAETLIEIAMTNPANAEIARRLPALGLSQCMLTAGCLFQAVWNHQSGRPAAWGIKDYDVFYFDEDESWDAENEVILAARAHFHDLDATIEIKNQARVHRWYTQRFGVEYPQLRSAKDGIDRYLIAGTCIGLDVVSGEVYAPYGLSDVEAGLLRINPVMHETDLFTHKAESYRARWPWLTIVSADAVPD